MQQSKRFPLGHYRGLAFGLVLHAGGAGEVFLEGAATRHAMLSRDHQGPRAVLNALDRLSGSYDGQCNATAADLAIAEGQHRDYQARLGRAFPHDGYKQELADLRDRLKAGLSQATPEPGTLPVAELAERIKSLKAAHTIDAAPERTAPRRIAAEEPVTARIRRRSEAAPVATVPPVEPEPAAKPEEMPPAAAATPARSEEATPPAVIHPFPEIPAAPVRQQPAYRQHAARARRQNDCQMSLF
jgi:hypothetical protein